MQKYRELADQVKEIYQKSGNAFNQFQKESGLTCLNGCGKCCLNPDISASLLEMLPLGIELIDNNKAEEVFERLSSPQLHCIFYEKNNPEGNLGQCRAYANRPSICRNFGASARINKLGTKEWVICKLIKEDKKEILDNIDINTSPVIGHFSTQIIALDPTLGRKLYPINEALRLILEKLLFIKQYET